jgi:hypothetical protein
MKMVRISFISVILIVLLTSFVVAQRPREQASFQWSNIPLRTSLDSLMQWFSESIVYLDKDVEGKSVNGVCTNCTIDEALSTVLSGTSLIWIRHGNQIILKEGDKEQLYTSVTISGTIIDSTTGEWIAGATVTVQDTAEYIRKIIRRWCPSNSFGFFSIPKIPRGQHIFTVRALGYETHTQMIDCSNNESVRLQIQLLQKEIIVKEVTVEGRRNAIASAEGLSRGAYRRAVPTDQNQYMLDGGRIYNPAHFGGVVSTFNPEVLNDVQVVLGGLPPYYGGRVGGIVDLSMRDGSRQRFSGSAGIGSLGSILSIEGPIVENTSFLISGRRGYPDAGMKLYPPKGQTPSRLGSAELIAKLTQRLSGSQQISLSGFLSGDKYENDVEGVGGKLDNTFKWGNSMLDLRWMGIVTPSLFLHASVVYSQYSFDLNHDFSENLLHYVEGSSSSKYEIEDFCLSAHAESYYDEDHTVRAGFELVHHRIDGYISKFTNQIAPYSLPNLIFWEASIYLMDQWKILPSVTAELGGRATSFSSKQGSFSSVDPRCSLLFLLTEQTHLYSAFSAINQFLHIYRNTGVHLLYPTIFWYPSSENVKPSTSLHLTLGLEHNWDEGRYVASTEVYYRITNNLHEIGYDSLKVSIADLESVIRNGSEKTYGLICSMSKRVGSFTGAVNYNLAWSFETFAEINSGKPFAPPLDRRHELQLSCSYELFENWNVGVLGVIISRQSSVIKPNYFLEKVERDNRGNVLTTPSYVQNGFVDVNGSRLPGFQRLELNVTHRFAFAGALCQLSLRFLNSYGRLDPFVWELSRDINYHINWSAELQEQKLFPLYPALEFIMRF